MDLREGHSNWNVRSRLIGPNLMFTGIEDMCYEQ